MFFFFFAVFKDSGFKRTLCGSKWDPTNGITGKKNAFDNLGDGDAKSTARYGCCPANKYMSFPEGTGAFTAADSCSACSAGRVSIPNDDTSEICQNKCPVGYTLSAAATSGSEQTCIGNTCTPEGDVANSNKATAGSITGTTTERVGVICNVGYAGSIIVVCQPNGVFSSVPTCAKCVLGKYNKDTNFKMSECKDDCDAGSYIVEDQSSCDACLYGQWQDLDDQHSCKKCAVGKKICNICSRQSDFKSNRSPCKLLRALSE